MTEEKIESQETKESATTDVVADDLEIAADELLGKVAEVKEEIKEEPKTEVKPKGEEDLEKHKESSQLGRKVKKLEDSLTDLSQKLDSYFSSLTPNRQVKQEEETSEIITTTQDLDRYLDRKKQKETQSEMERARTYETSYVREVRKLSGEDEEMGDELLKELFTKESPFNRYITGNPIADARINYAEASKATLRKKIASTKPKPNVKGEKSQVSTNIMVTNRESSEGTGLPALDDFARDFVNKTKMSEDSVKVALGRK